MTIDPKVQAFYDLLSRIADRAIKLGLYPATDKMGALMDLESVSEQVNFTTLDHFSDGNFCHDVGGIRDHLDRREFPASLTGCFWPRCARN